MAVNNFEPSNDDDDIEVPPWILIQSHKEKVTLPTNLTEECRFSSKLEEILHWNTTIHIKS
jgi:hypothetical protein